LAKEILGKQPTATVIASEFEEVIAIGQKYLSSRRFYVFGSHDLRGAELAGVLKNIFALASGVLYGKGYGKNIQAMLITRGLREMIALGKALGSDSMAFLGTAGIGDLIATATSSLSRNFSFGEQLGKGIPKETILSDMDEVVEGLRTLKFAYILALKFKIHVPITSMIYKVVYEDFEIDKAIHFLMKYPRTTDVDFL
jgi:glycerol-3-phosphate dehydrogenase (NAD(P)+)